MKDKVHVCTLIIGLSHEQNKLVFSLTLLEVTMPTICLHIDKTLIMLTQNICKLLITGKRKSSTNLTECLGMKMICCNTCNKYPDCDALTYNQLLITTPTHPYHYEVLFITFHWDEINISLTKCAFILINSPFIQP